LLGHTLPDFNGQPRLTDPTGSGQSHQASGADQVGQFKELPFPTNKAGELERKPDALGAAEAECRRLGATGVFRPV
jgi:hypothetical protein